MPDTRRTLQEQLEPIRPVLAAAVAQGGASALPSVSASAAPAEPPAAVWADGLLHQDPDHGSLAPPGGTATLRQDDAALGSLSPDRCTGPKPAAQAAAVADEDAAVADEDTALADTDGPAERDASLQARERALEDAADALQWERLAHQLEVQQCAGQRQQLELEVAKAQRRERQLARKAKNLATKESELNDREAALDARVAKTQAAVVRYRQRGVELRAANGRVTELERRVDALTKARDRLQKQVDRTRERERVPVALQIATWDLAQWMIGESAIDSADFGARVAFCGDGPFSRADMERSARGLGLQVGRCGARQPATLLVVGREGWDASAIQRHVDSLADAEIFVFPQELWVASVLIGYNPFRSIDDDECRQALEAFGLGHPVIEWLRGQEFPWPQWEAAQGDPGPNIARQVKVSPLVKLNYRVGTTQGLPMAERQRVLSEALSAAKLPDADFEAGVPVMVQQQYMESWGLPSSRARLRRMAWHLAMLVGMHTRLRDHQVAVREWQADLAWLKKTYYSTLMRFQWP